MIELPVAVTFDFLTAWDFWIAVGILAGIYGIFALGLQLNVGYTGVLNFGQAGFMAIGAYAAIIFVVELGWSYWLALPASALLTMIVGLLIGLPSLRLRADYFAIATIAFSEIVRDVGLLSGRTFYSRFGDVFAWSALAATLGITVAALRALRGIR